MGDRVADAKALGFSAFAIIAWMNSMLGAGWTAPDASVLNAVVVFAGFALLIAALASFLRGEAWHAAFFLFWSALLMGYKASMSMGMAGPSAYAGWYDITVVVVSFLLFMAAQRSGFELPVVLLSIGVTLTFLAEALGGWLGGSFWMVISGYIGLATGLVSFWAAAVAFGQMGGGKTAAAPSAPSGGMGG
ncbi:MAG TPA: hypothetical protein VJ957_09245 [Longimicrobiales bacterium]|nr:hypothetical protein [Longimicrobiales bacterium]